MNKPHNDQVFDSLLEEMLTKQHPPDLTARILTAWQRERSHLAHPDLHDSAESLPLVSPEMVQAELAKAEMVKAEVVEAAKSKSRGRSPAAAGNSAVSKQFPQVTLPERQDGWDAGARRRLAVLLAACAAALLLLVGWRVFWPGQTPEQTVVQQPGDTPGGALANRNANTQPTPKSAPQLANNAPQPPVAGSTNESPGEVLAIDDLPFSTPELSRTSSPALANKPAQPVTRLDSPQVVAGLDQRLGELWNMLGVEPTSRYDDRALAQQISMTLTGQELSDGWLQTHTDERNGLDMLALAEQATGSAAFARRWADQFAQQWLAGGSISVNNKLVDELKRAVATRIETSAPWNDVIVDLRAPAQFTWELWRVVKIIGWWNESAAIS